MLEALKRSNSTENFISQSSSSEECLHTSQQYNQGDRLQYSQGDRLQYSQGDRLQYSQGDRLQYNQGERLQYSLESVGSLATSEEEGDIPGKFHHYIASFK
jgi:hypothetical protein